MKKKDIVTIQLPGKEPVDAICFDTYRADYQSSSTFNNALHSAILLDEHGYLYALAPDVRFPRVADNPYRNEITKYPLEMINLKEFCDAINEKKVYHDIHHGGEEFEDAKITAAPDSECKDQLKLVERYFSQIIREYNYLMSSNNDIEQQIRALAQKKEENKDIMCEVYNELTLFADDLQQNKFGHPTQDISDDFGQEMDE